MASFVLLCKYSIQSSSSISVVSISSSVPFSKDTSLSWSLALPVFTFVASATQVVGVFFFVGLVFSFHDIFVSSFRLYDESKHFALRRLNHSFVPFCVPDA